MNRMHRRDFLCSTAAAGAAAGLGLYALPLQTARAQANSSKMQFGLVTYLWGKDMDLPTLLAACEQSQLLGVELRTEHAHGVEPSLSKDDRADVRKRFADSPVELVGYGSNAEFHSPDPAEVKRNIELTKQYIHLMHDCGGSGVKVKPNSLPQGVAREKTIEQIGRALNEVAEYGQGYGQEIRVEVHGSGTSELPVVAAIFEVADHPNVGVCWNSNDVDLHGKGLKHNFDLVNERFGRTAHVRELDDKSYPYQELFDLLVAMNYAGWVLLEARTAPQDKVAAMKQQRAIFDRLVSDAQK